MKEDDYPKKSSREKGKTTTSRLTERRNSESELEKRLQRAMDAGHIFSWEMNPATRELDWSSNMEDVIGFRLDPNVDKNLDAIHPDDIQTLIDAVKRAVETGDDYECEFRLVNPATGEDSWFYSRGAMTYDTADGEPRLTGITRNVTIRKRSLLNADFLASVSNDLARLRTADEIMRTVGAQIGDFLKLAGCTFVEINEGDDTATVLHDWYNNERGRSLLGTYRIADFIAESYYRGARRSEVFVVQDTRTDERVNDEYYHALGIRSFISVPFFRNGEWRFVLSLNDAQPRHWRKDEISLAHELANRIWAVVERSRAEDALIKSEERLRITIEAAEMATWDWDLKANEVVWNDRHFSMLGLEPGENPVAPELFFKYVHPGDREEVESLIEASIKNKTVFDTVFRVVTADGRIRWVSDYGNVTEVVNSTATRLSGVMFDITERKEAEEALRQSEEQSRLLVEGATDFAIFRITEDGLIASWNVGAQRVFGYTESEITGQPVGVLFTPEDREKKIPEREMEIARREGRAEDERWHQRCDGSRFFASGVLMRLDEGVKGFVKIARDQTHKLVAEKTQRDKEILQKMVSAQEEERKRIARDLHDELGQQLTALRLKLERIKILCTDDRELCRQIEDAQSLAGSIDHGVDFLAWELRPFVLDDLGLAAALGKYVEEWSRHSGVSAEFINLGKGQPRLRRETETNLYRIVQEALNNVHKHAGAGRAEVMLEKRRNSVILIIEDDGVGFNPEDKKTPDKGLGLIGMRERAALIGGSVEIESSIGSGTTIFVRAPAHFD